MLKTSMQNDGFQGCFYETGSPSETALIVLTGSEGKLAYAQAIATRFAKRGIPSIAVAYFKTAETLKDLAEIPVEIIEHTIGWLKNRGFEKIAIYGFSTGAEYALLAASLLQQINAVIAISPSCCIFEGLTAKKRPAAKSSWSWQGKALPYVPFGSDIPHYMSSLLKYGEIRFVGDYNRLLDTKTNAANMIAVERIHGPLLLISAHDDAMWPSERMGNLIINRLKNNNFPFPYRHEVYHYASHMLCPIHSPANKIFKMERKYPRECDEARAHAFELAVDLLNSLSEKGTD